MTREIIEAVRTIEREKGIEEDTLIHALEDALLAAYKKTPGASRHATVELDPDSGDFRVYSIEIPEDLEVKLMDEARELIVPERLEAHLIVETIDEGTYIDPETGEPDEPQDPEIDPAKFEEYRDQIDEQDVTPDDFGRIAAQTAKQVILQRIREAEREMMYEEYKDRQGEVVTGIVQQAGDRNNVLVDLGKVEALLPRSEQVDGERYEQGSRIKAVITEVRSGTKGPQVILSRRDPELIKTLFELEVPEIADGLVEIRGVAREPGYRSKIAVESHAQGVDPVGACVGPRGSRVRMVVSELRGEKIDIIPYNDEPARFVAKALSPARVREVLVDDDGRQATVIVPDDQLSLAIGREGQNARLAARLTGWRVDIKSETEFSAEEAEHGYDEEEVSGRCAAIMSTGRRCPNASLPGLRYCGLDSHQALRRFDTDQVAVLSGLDQSDLAALADAERSDDDVAEIVARASAGAPPDAPAAEEPPPEEPAAEEGLAEEAAAEPGLAEVAEAPAQTATDAAEEPAQTATDAAEEPAPSEAPPSEEALAQDAAPEADGQPAVEESPAGTTGEGSA